MNQNKKDEQHEPSADKWVPHVSGTPFSHLFFVIFAENWLGARMQPFTA